MSKDGSERARTKVVVTGGAGFYGSVLVRQLLAAGYQVHVIDNLMYGPHTILELFIRPNFKFTHGDILDRKLLGEVLQDADAVVHLAALVGYPLCKKEPERARAVNVQGTTNVIELLPAQSKLIYASTGSNYGEVMGICTEETPLNPLSLYGETKTLAEHMCMERPNSVSFRFATAFGLSPRLRLDLMINDFAWQALVQRFLVVYEKHFRRTFIHVWDMARAVTFTLDHWAEMQNEVFNVGQDSMNYTKEDIIMLLQKKLDFMVHFAEVGTDADKRDYAVSYAKINRLGFFTEVDIHRGTDELISGLRLVDFRRPYSNV